MESVCRGWREALRAQEADVWKPVALRRFPRLEKMLDILKALPSLPKYSFVEHYREQLKAESSIAEPKPPSVTTQLSDFVFTAELVSTSEPRRIVDAWTGVADGVLSERSGGDASFLLPIDWHLLWRDPAPRLELFVSRALNGRIRTRKLFSEVIRLGLTGGWDYDEVDDGIVYFRGISIPLSKRYSAEFDVERVAISLEISYPESADDDDGPPSVLIFELALNEDLDPMNVYDLLAYLEHGVDWE